MRPKARINLWRGDSAAPEILTPGKKARARSISLQSAQTPPRAGSSGESDVCRLRTAPKREDKKTQGRALNLRSNRRGDATTLIAPVRYVGALVAPPASIPPGNLSARISIFHRKDRKPARRKERRRENGTSASPSAGAGRPWTRRDIHQWRK